MERASRNVILFSVGLALLAGASLGHLALVARGKARLATCQSSEKMLMYAMQAYAQDYDGRLPVRPWQEVFWSERCPDDRGPATPSFALHGRWTHEPLQDGKDVAGLIMIYESTPEPFAYRHFRGMNVGFLDGHVHWYRRSILTPQMIQDGVVTAPSPPAP